MDALFAICVLVLVDFYDLFDLVEIGMLATFWEATGVTIDRDIPSFWGLAMFRVVACSCWGW